MKEKEHLQVVGVDGDNMKIKMGQESKFYM
jgi:hypothetical protein